MKVVDSLWFTNTKGTVGIVIIEEDVTRDRKAYIGVGNGHNEAVDTQSIIDWGTLLSISALGRITSQLFPYKPRGKEGEGLKRQKDVIGTNLDGDPLINRTPGIQV